VQASCIVETAEPKTGDAWGRALLDHCEQREVVQPMLEVDGRDVGPAMLPEWFFRPFDAWDWWERELLSEVRDGPVLDLGCGAGRAALYFQGLGLDVTAVDNSPGAVEVCRRRGVVDARVGDLNDPPDDRVWGAVLLLCGNIGLGGSWSGNRALLRKLAQLSSPGAVLVGDSVNFDGDADLRLRIRYGEMVTPWWRQRNVKAVEIPALVAATGWRVDRQLEDGLDHAVLLRRADS
jgi:SAM-dependent methyltransferase